MSKIAYKKTCSRLSEPMLKHITQKTITHFYL